MDTTTRDGLLAVVSSEEAARRTVRDLAEAGYPTRGVVIRPDTADSDESRRDTAAAGPRFDRSTPRGTVAVGVFAAVALIAVDLFFGSAPLVAATILLVIVGLFVAGVVVAVYGTFSHRSRSDDDTPAAPPRWLVVDTDASDADVVRARRLLAHPDAGHDRAA